MHAVALIDANASWWVGEGDGILGWQSVLGPDDARSSLSRCAQSGRVGRLPLKKGLILARVLLVFLCVLAALTSALVVPGQASSAAGPSDSIVVRDWNRLVYVTLDNMYFLAESDVNSKPDYRTTYLRCYTDAGWKRVTGGEPGLMGFYLPGSPYVHARQMVCLNAVKAMRGQLSRTNIVAFATLLHETFHRQGIRNEASAECLANLAVYHGLTRHGEFRAANASAIALDWSRRHMPDRYLLPFNACIKTGIEVPWTDWRDS